MGKEISADYSGVAPRAGGDGGGDLLPIKDAAGKRIKYLGKITAAEPKMSTNPWVQYELKVVGGEFDGKELKYQNITFLPKAHEYAGIALHFLKCLRVDFEGKFKVKPDEWAGRYIYFYVKHEESTKTKADGTPYVNNKVAGVDVVDIPTLIDLGEYTDATDAPEWLQEAQAAMDEGEKGAKTEKKAEPKAASKTAKEKVKSEEPAASAPCELCDVPFSKHKGKKHEFKEGVPF